MYKIGIDVGGTFTDIVFKINPGRWHTAKCRLFRAMSPKRSSALWLDGRAREKFAAGVSCRGRGYKFRHDGGNQRNAATSWGTDCDADDAGLSRHLGIAPWL